MLGATDEAKSSYVQWLLPDAGRAEIPLGSSDNEEKFPTGMAIVNCSQKNITSIDGR